MYILIILANPDKCIVFESEEKLIAYFDAFVPLGDDESIYKVVKSDYYIWHYRVYLGEDSPENYPIAIGVAVDNISDLLR